MEIVVSLAVGLLAAAGVWLVLRPRTFQVLIGLSLLSYAINLFIFSVGSLAVDAPPIVRAGALPDLAHYTDPVPQALVLTAIVIGFATTALFLVVLLALRGLSGVDHVDGKEEPEEMP
ncbi:MAG: Na+/H+ antiporter subunit C [Burkholderiales bacterium]|nr:Na+/H+ antiporter subunit C [Burkholderiales bacterium]